MALIESHEQEGGLNFLKGYVRFADRLSEGVGRGTSWLSTLLVLVVCYDVLTRYLLKSSSVAVQELEWHLFSLLFLLAAAYTLRHDKHVRVDVLYTRFSPSLQSWVNLLGSLLFLVPFCLLVIWSSRKFVWSSYSIGETSPDPGGLPRRWLLKSAIPLSFSLLLLQGFALACRSWLEIARSKETAGSKEKESQ